ncbi:MAG: hypothetical protein ABI615_01730, partial [Chthoniobacterales bacterium]
MMPFASKLRPSCGSSLAENSLGRSVSMRRGGQWRHPWFTAPTWNAHKKKWVASVKPGFVNGVAPTVRTTAGDMRDARGTWFGQLVDAFSGAAEIARAAALAISQDSDLPDDATVDVPLYLSPPINLLSWKFLGWDGEAQFPPYFLSRGVSRPGPSAESVLESGGEAPPPPKGLRLLRSCDVILHQPRVALSSQINIAGTLVSQVLDETAPVAGDSLRLLSGNFSAIQDENSRANPNEGVNALVNNFQEAPSDQIIVSTVYLLSPPNTAPGAYPDGTWEAFAAHSLFWNLHWTQPRLLQVSTNFPITAALGAVKFLGGGAGAVAIDYFANSVDEATNAALNLIRGSSLAGTFWTPTGGGTTSADPIPSVIAAIKTTLDKAANYT